MRMMLACASVLLLTVGVEVNANSTDQRPGDTAFDVAPFGFRTSYDSGAAHGLRWAEPRKVRRVIVEFADGQSLPDASQVRLQYWHRVWDGKADPLLIERGAGGVGWDAMDDWTNGRWITVKGRVKRTGKAYEFTFAPTSSDEIPKLTGEGVTYRKTLAVRVAGNGGIPAPSRFQVYTDSVCRPLRVRIQFDEPHVAQPPSVGITPGGGGATWELIWHEFLL